jgi:hypothetical protein
MLHRTPRCASMRTRTIERVRQAARQGPYFKAMFTSCPIRVGVSWLGRVAYPVLIAAFAQSITFDNVVSRSAIAMAGVSELADSSTNHSSPFSAPNFRKMPAQGLPRGSKFCVDSGAGMSALRGVARTACTRILSDTHAALCSVPLHRE